MRTRTATWFETKIQYEKTMEDGLQKKVKEQYVVDALSFTEAEKRITEEMSSYISGAFDVADIKKATYKEIFFSDEATSDRWYKAKVQFITIDEKTEKDEVMGGTMIDYAIAAISETTVMDVFEYQKSNKE